jgi:hypothetical protein
MNKLLMSPGVCVVFSPRHNIIFDASLASSTAFEFLARSQFLDQLL